MTTYADYDSQSIGVAKVIDESPYSPNGETALEILNFSKNEEGILESFFRIMPLVHPSVLTGEAVADVPDAFSQTQGCRAIAYADMEGGVPEILFLTGEGVFRYAPWDSGAGANRGLEEQLFYRKNNTTSSVTPPLRTYFPPQWEALGNRIYFTFCDGGLAWVWDRTRLRPFGYIQRPSAPDAQGPTPDESDVGNAGGFSVKGRIGTTENNWMTQDHGAGPGGEDYHVVGGMDDGEWHYYELFEGTDGHYSATSVRGGVVNVNADIGEEGLIPADLLRRFRVLDASRGPESTAARILLRTANLRRLPPGDDGSPRFLHRLSGDVADEWIDDIPDGELGAAWQNREVTPGGFYLLKGFSGSLFMGRTDAYPSRVWWSEQTNLNGPTPESIMEGHWRDIFPNTGGITGFHEAQLGNDPSSPILLVFKPRAVHFIAGQYPNWQIGTVHRSAGLAGPNLIQALPDGTTLWYGNRTFWLLDLNGQIRDVGKTIRKRLRRVNYTTARMGSSFVNRRKQEAVFSLPMDSSTKPDYQFIWDYEMGGFRAGNQMEIHAALELPENDMVLVSGTYDDEDNVFIWDRGSYDFDTANGNKYNGLNAAEYWSGWVPMKTGPESHGAWNLHQLIVVGLESSEDSIRLRTYGNWNRTVETGDESVSLTAADPEDDAIPFWDSSVAATAADEPATLGEDIYRLRRPYSVNAPIDIPSAEVSSVRLTVDAGEWFSLIGMSIYGPQVAPPGGRTSKVAEASEQ